MRYSDDVDDIRCVFVVTFASVHKLSAHWNTGSAFMHSWITNALIHLVCSCAAAWHHNFDKYDYYANKRRETGNLPHRRSRTRAPLSTGVCVQNDGIRQAFGCIPTVFHVEKFILTYLNSSSEWSGGDAGEHYCCRMHTHYSLSCINTLSVCSSARQFSHMFCSYIHFHRCWLGRLLSRSPRNIWTGIFISA